jgi:hypothetical protein
MSTASIDQPAARGGLLRAAGITLVAALVANLVIWAIAQAVSDVPDRFTPLQPGTVVFFTVLGVAGAAGLLALLRSRSADPAGTFRKIVPVVLVVSLIPDVLIWAQGAYDDAAKAETVLPLMAMHIVTAAICWAILPAAGRRSEKLR